MENNIKFNFEFTLSKVSGMYLIIASKWILPPELVITGITIGAGLIGYKQTMDALKKIKGGTGE